MDMEYRDSTMYMDYDDEESEKREGTEIEDTEESPAAESSFMKKMQEMMQKAPSPSPVSYIFMSLRSIL